LGTDIASAMTTLEALRVDVIGLNCSTGPEHMREPIRFLAGAATRPVSCIPNAGLPLNTGTGDAVYPLEPEPMAQMLGEFVDQFGVRIVGGCCGTTPEHMAAIVKRVSKDRNPERSEGSLRVERDPSLAALPQDDNQAGGKRGSRVPRASSAMRATDFDQNPKPLLIGERVNAQGSRKVKRLLLAEDYEGISDVAREQVESGAHILDVCVAVTERGDEAEQMAKVVKLLSMTVDTPIMIDSTEPAVIQRALEAIPGRAIINSINMENGRKRIDDVVPLATKHGAALVALTIDEIGMAKTRERKLEVAKKIYDIVVGEYGLKAEDLIYDDLLHARDGRCRVDRLCR
jgi:5-methyltetrahydrofolate--homocysteine methyltransferase